MKRFKFNEEDLTLREESPYRVLKIWCVFIVVVVGIIWAFLSFIPAKKEYVWGETHLTITKKENTFSEELLVKELSKYNFRFPDIVLAQAMLESGNYSSPVFKDNHNLFGMRQAFVRMNVASGTNRGHAIYENWRESVVDRALYEEAYLRKIKDREEYLTYLNVNYAEDSGYIEKIEHIITMLSY